MTLTRDEVAKLLHDNLRVGGDSEIACLARVALKYGPDGQSWQTLNAYRKMGRI